MISKMLTRHGYRVLTASDGAEATGYFAKHANEIRLVVSDLNMPNLDGAMLARVLKRMNPDVRMLIVSGLDAPAERHPGFKPEEFTGAFLRKPFRSDELLRKTAELLQRRPAPWDPSADSNRASAELAPEKKLAAVRDCNQTESPTPTSGDRVGPYPKSGRSEDIAQPHHEYPP